MRFFLFIKIQRLVSNCPPPPSTYIKIKIQILFGRTFHFPIKLNHYLAHLVPLVFGLQLVGKDYAVSQPDDDYRYHNLHVMILESYCHDAF